MVGLVLLSDSGLKMYLVNVAVRGHLKLTTDKSSAIYCITSTDLLLHHTRADNSLYRQSPIFLKAVRAICTT
jgi:hypothetical protein